MDTKTPNASLFQVQSYYNIIDNSGYTAPNLGAKAPPSVDGNRDPFIGAHLMAVLDSRYPFTAEVYDPNDFL